LNRPKHGGNLNWAATVAGCPPSDLLDFSASINPLGPPESVHAAILSNLESIASYPDPQYPDLRQAIANHHNIAPEWVLPGNGAAELLTWAAWELSHLDATLIISPAFGDYYRSLATFGSKILPRSLVGGDGSIQDFDFALRNLPDEIPHRLGIIINNPHNPTGQIWSPETIEPYLDRFSLIVVDESFMDFIPPTERSSLISLLPKYPNLAILRSLTKFYSLPGLRLGYMLAHPDRLRRWYNWRDPWPVNTLASVAGIAALADTEFQQQTWAWLAVARDKLFTGLKQIPSLVPYPGAANFLFVKTQLPATKIQTQLLTHDRVLIRDCLSFPELKSDRFFRVAVKSIEDNDRLLSGLNRLTAQ
jgi:L-threonine-O-3-phosphate decarboxylase